MLGCSARRAKTFGGCLQAAWCRGKRVGRNWRAYRAHWQLSLRVVPGPDAGGRGLLVASFRDVLSLTAGPLRPGELLRAFAANLPPVVGARRWTGPCPATRW